MIKIIVCLALVAAFVSASPDTSFKSERLTQRPFQKQTTKSTKIQTHQFTAKLNHFQPQDLRTITLTYHENDVYYYPGGPIYIYLKAIGDTSNRYIEEGLMVQLAAENNGTVLTFDYRYFGDNRIFDELTWDDYRFLTIEQIIADVGTLVNYKRYQHVYGSRVVLWGSKFGAYIANYARAKFPHLITGAWSSSGVFDIEPFSYGYYDTLENPIRATGTEHCYERLRDAFYQLASLVASESGENIQNRLNLCKPLETNVVADIASLGEKWVDVLGEYIDQYHIRGVHNFCDDIESTTVDALDSVARWVNFVTDSDLTCFDHSYADRVANLSQTTITEVADQRTWYYLKCTQFGLFQIADLFTWLPLPITRDYHLQFCAEILGGGFTEYNLVNAVHNAQIEIGNFAQYHSEVIYTNGLIDPWLYDNYAYVATPNSTYLTISYASASSDLGEVRGWDTVQVAEAKERIIEQIRRWSRY